MKKGVLMGVVIYLIGGLAMLYSGQQPERLQQQLEELVTEELAKGNFPGAVIYVGNADSTILLEAYGYKTEKNGLGKMSTDAIFDLASVTKPVATATAVLLLVEQGKIELNAPVGRYIPRFAQKGKEGVQVNHLLTHTSGLPAYMNAQNLRNKYGSPCPEELLEEVYALSLQSEPGETIRYSCLGYIVLGKLVESVSGQDLAEFTRKNLWEPLRMKDTTFNPPSRIYNRIAPTHRVSGEPARGKVHDPLARLMDGISGNAGLFSTAEDLARYCRMLLNDGKYRNREVMSSSTVFFLTNEQSHGRSYGFDVSSSYSWIKGDYAAPATISHSGYTGTSLVLDHQNELFIIILTNRSYPNDGGSVHRLRREAADIIHRELITGEE